MIYLIRHGEAAAAWGEHPDPGLSPAGQEQATNVAELLSTKPVKQVLSSPMQRCRETAEAFSNRSGFTVSIEPRVIEIPTPPDVVARREWLRALMHGKWRDAPVLVQEWREELLEAVATLPDQTAVFTHFIAINAIVGDLEDREEVTLFRPDYCSVTTLAVADDGLALVERGQEAGTRVL